MEDWVGELQGGRPDAAWDRFLTRYRRLIFAAIRHYARDPDDVMDIFARVCEALREDGLRRLRSYFDETRHRAKFSTWLVGVVRHLAIDWFRHRDGRRRLTAATLALPPLERRIFELVFLDRHGHVEAYEMIRSGEVPTLGFREYLAALRATYRSAGSGRYSGLVREVPPPPEEPDPPDEEEAGRRREHLESVLATLPPEDRAALRLYVVEGMAADAVARVLGLPNSKAVYNRVYRILAALRSRLEQAGLGRDDL